MAAKKATKKSTTTKKKSAPEKKSTVKAPKKTVAAKRTTTKSGKAKTTSKEVEKNNQITTAAASEKQKTSSQEKTTPTPRAVRFKKSYAILIVVVIAFAIALYACRSLLVAAVVNGQPIPRWSVIHEAEKQSGKQALDTMVRNKLIEEEAAKKHITVSDKEVDTEVNNLKSNLAKQGQNFDQVLKAQGMTVNDLRELIRLDKLVGKLVGNNINITDKQVNDYISANKDSLPQGQSDAQMKASVRDQLKQQELNDKVKTWLDNLQKQAKINYFVNYE